jgi:hypothetical protein
MQISDVQMMNLHFPIICTFAHLKFAHLNNARDRTILPLEG